MAQAYPSYNTIISGFPTNVVSSPVVVDYNAPVVNPVVYPTKDLWKALWLSVSADIQAGTSFTVGSTSYSVYGLQFTLTGYNKGLAAAVNYTQYHAPIAGDYATNTIGIPAIAPAGAWGTLTFTLADSANAADQLIGQTFEFPNYVFPGGTNGTVSPKVYIAALV